MRFAPVAADNLLYGREPLAADRPYRKFQDKPLGVRTTGHLKPNASEQRTALAECQFPLSGQFMNIKSRTLDIAQLALRIMSTRSSTAHRRGSVMWPPCNLIRRYALSHANHLHCMPLAACSGLNAERVQPRGRLTCG
jgi:hypothetical protein